MNGPSLLHVAALNFPTVQGTQAALFQMVEGLALREPETHLLTYSHGAFPMAGAFHHHKVPNWPSFSSFRSGPSLRKIILDVRLAIEIRKLCERIKPDVVIAHHVEAAAAAIVSRVRCPIVYLAHTWLARELPLYGPKEIGFASEMAARTLESWIFRNADAVAAVSPALCKTLSSLSGKDVVYTPIPWSVPNVITHDERIVARTALQIPLHARVMVYAGNLDAYQGLDMLADAVKEVVAEDPHAILLVASASDPANVQSMMFQAGISHAVRYAVLGDESSRRIVHAVADIAVIPRRAPGGLPVKLLDALSRGVPTVAAERATGGIAVNQIACVTENDSRAFARGILKTLSNVQSHQTNLRRAFVLEHHSIERFCDALLRVSALATTMARTKTISTSKNRLSKIVRHAPFI